MTTERKFPLPEPQWHRLTHEALAGPLGDLDRNIVTTEHALNWPDCCYTMGCRKPHTHRDTILIG